MSKNQEREEYDFHIVQQELEARHQARDDFHATSESGGPPFFSLAMFPYPSGNAHMGHVRVYSISDVKARYQRLKGSTVLHPIGWDAFGLPAENAAIKHAARPDEWTAKNIWRMKNEQLNRMGWSFDWHHEIDTSSPDYYRWTQWLFAELFRSGRAYRKAGPVNWCPVDQTVLADEQVIDGRCWRDGALVEKRDMVQWYLKTTDYADRLWADLDKLVHWAPEAVAVQRNWIGRATGATIDFAVEGQADVIQCFTTRADTLFGVTAVVLAPEHPLVAQLIARTGNTELETYVHEAGKKSAVDRMQAKTKTGVRTGIRCRHPLTNASIEVWSADYVIAGYGSGAVMCVPAHDTRDFEFATAHGLPVVRVIDDPARPGEPLPQVDDGVLVDSARFSGFASAVARSEITVALKEAGRGGPSTIFHLRDWSVGRQRYWGCPIPIVYCPQCGTVAEDRLPVLLPSMDLLPTGRLQLSAVESFVNTTCPQCGAAARRETDTLDTFFDSAWYAFRFTDPHNDRLPFGREAAERWMPIDFYVGGLEHASQHMLYFRFITKCLFDLGLVGFDEPVDHFFCNGMVRFGGHKMSKSRGNIVVPTEIVEKYGADALRLYILSDAPAEFDIDWNDQGIVAKLEFVGRNVRVLGEFLEAHRQVAASDDFTTFETRELLRLCYASILSIQTSLDANSFHTAVARIHEFSNGLRKALSTPTSQANIGGLKYLVREFLVVFGVFAPFAAEYLYRRYFDPDGSIYTLEWPRMRSEFLSVASVEIVVQVNGKKRGVLSAGIDASEEEVERAALSHESVATALKDKSVIRRLYVQNKILNFIVAK